ncbi:MAG: hypothetical protein AB7P40_06285 [Chloroflexota bacterium]
MRVAPEEEHDGEVPAGDGALSAPTPDDVQACPQPARQARTDAEARAERLQPGRRARQQARLQQAVATRRRVPFRWSETSRRLATGVALLVLMAVVSGMGGEYFRNSGTLVYSVADGGAGRRGTLPPTEIPTVQPAPRPEPEILPGPEISIGMIEANGPVAGCSIHPRFTELGERVGQTLLGHCVEDPRPAADGNVRQRTVHGELFWFQEDSRAAFTDGAHVWMTGPTGIVRRGIGERFAWERDADAGPRPARNEHVLPPALPGSVLPAKRIVSYYGNPLSSGMGILGELPPEKLFPRLREQAAAYEAADKTRPVIPALELVTVVAQAQPGADGLYRLRMDTELIEKVSTWAEEQGFLLILDVQIGWGNVDDEVRWLLPFLKRKHIHLALDPEFAMQKGVRPGAKIGTMDADAINGAMKTLSNLVESEGLPPKLLLVHRFTEDMVTNWQQIAHDPKVQVVMVMDGFGNPAIKSRQYNELIVDQRVEYTGFKLFYSHDEPLMTPTQVLQLDPSPDLIIYQ